MRKQDNKISCIGHISVATLKVHHSDQNSTLNGSTTQNDFSTCELSELDSIFWPGGKLSARTEQEA